MLAHLPSSRCSASALIAIVFYAFAVLRAAGPVGVFTWFRFTMYRMHLGLVEQTIRWIDPYLPTRFREMPPYSPERAERFRSIHRPIMRAWSFFGVGTHIFAMAACAMADSLEWYILLRAFAFNAALLVLVPVQRRASRAFFGTGETDATPATA